MKCEHCEQTQHTYKLTCGGCRTRMAQHEFCKFLRKQLVDANISYGETKNWKEGKNCGCDKKCERLARVQVKEDVAVIARSPLRGLRDK